MNAYIVFKEEQSAHAALSNNMTEIGGNHIRVDMACPPRKKMKGVARPYDRKRTVFVGNLPFDVKDEELYQLFCGLSQSEPNVEAVRVIRDPNTSIGKGIAYVLFKTREAANNVCKRRDLKIRDRNLRVCHAKPDATPSEVKETPSKDFSHGRPAPASSSTPSAKDNKRNRADNSSASYEGLRSSKTGVAKKSSIRPSQSNSTIDNGSKNSSWNEQQHRKTKRPAVAAKKAKQLQKRKQSDGTPESSRQNKRVRRQ
ncbi:nucleolar protein 12-like [Phalaenopsis equestris]|uniref:nucleolar protein 12-like n=1 Tax=Phalaenopsis equestris TaxID=78828 RepID=UPI0009E26433|nr:nucleolar protein 12-like [Phalaenopsis equestris]